MNLKWLNLHHSELSTVQLYQLLALRNAVFIVEQQCPYLDIDGADLSGQNRHIMGMLDDRLIACARILAPQPEDNAPVTIGRVIVADEARGLHLGIRLMEQAIGCCEHNWPGRHVLISAQAHLQRFYGGMGFVAVSGEYLEDDIPHIDMRLG